VKHGAFAETAILPGEDPREFEELHSALIEEWGPVGPTEEDAVLSLAKGMWRKRRLQKFRHAEIEMCRSNPEHPLYNEAQGLRTLLNTIEMDLDLKESRPDLFEGCIRIAILSAPSYLGTTLERFCPREKFESVSDWFAMLRVIISGLLQELERSGEDPDLLLHRSAKVHTPDVVDHELAVDERIDAMIDRAVKRLVQIKATKQMLVGTSPPAGGDLRKKIQSGETARADRARQPLRGKRSRGGHRKSSEDVRRGPGNAQPDVDLR
jgi:hypothetical protein